MFDKFKDTNGEFKETIINDVKGILSLYEASFLSVQGEQILDDALVFTKANLESLAMQSSPRLADHFRNALIRPFHKGVPRIEARKYISFYEEDESRIDTYSTQVCQDRFQSSSVNTSTRAIHSNFLLEFLYSVAIYILGGGMI